jgi:hypothetical protein
MKIHRAAARATALFFAIAGAEGQMIPQVAGNAALKAMPTTQYPAVIRLGFTQSGDGGLAMYQASSAACALNSGNGDDGAQVKSADGKCWLADLSSGVASVGLWGAKGDGVTDDATAINNALSNPSSATILVPKGTWKYGATIHIPVGKHFVGQGFAESRLSAKTANLTAISLDGDQTEITGITVDASGGGSNSSGSAISVADGTRETLIDSIRINGPFTGISLGTSVLITVQNSYIYNPTPSTGLGIHVTGSGNNQIIQNVFIQGDPAKQPRAAIEVNGTGGLWLNNAQGLSTGHGLILLAATGQAITWVFDTQSAWDTGTGNGMLIEAVGTGSIRGVFSTGSWTSTMENFGVAVIGAGVDGVDLTAHRVFNNQHQGIVIQDATNVVFNGGSVCGNGGAAPGTLDGIAIHGAATKVSILNSTIGNCAGFPANTQNYPIGLDGTADGFMAIGNTFTGNTSNTINGAAATQVVANNLVF